jgi:hypothetical protein
MSYNSAQLGIGNDNNQKAKTWGAKGHEPRKGMMRTRRRAKQARVTHTRLHTQEQQINGQPKQ